MLIIIDHENVELGRLLHRFTLVEHARSLKRCARVVVRCLGMARLQELLVEQDVVDASTLVRAAAQADREGISLAQILVEQAVLQEDALAELAAAALQTVVVDVVQGSLDAHSVSLLPVAVARRHLVIPVAPDPDGSSLRVAFADPTDQDAVAAVQRYTGMGVQPLVATVSGILTAIRRAYSEHAIADQLVAQQLGLDGGAELPAEPTKRVGAVGEITEATAPLHRYDNVATIEQRLEALVLSLVDAGVISRADYMEALRRLMGRK